MRSTSNEILQKLKHVLENLLLFRSCCTLLRTGAVSSERRPVLSSHPINPQTRNSLRVAWVVAMRTPLLMHCRTVWPARAHLLDTRMPFLELNDSQIILAVNFHQPRHYALAAGTMPVSLAPFAHTSLDHSKHQVSTAT